MILGEIRKGQDIGKSRWHKYIWQACPKCGKERWTLLTKGQPMSLFCHKCGVTDTVRQKMRASHLGKLMSQETKQRMSESRKRDRHHLWQGGRIADGHGYIKVLLTSDDPYLVMGGKYGYVKEHRLIMTRYLGRVLNSDEIVHHMNGVRTDNRIINLAIVTRGNHPTKTLLKLLQQRIRNLEGQLAQAKLV